MQTMIFRIQEKNFTSNNLLYLNIFKLFLAMILQKEEDMLLEVEKVIKEKSMENTEIIEEELVFESHKEPLSQEDFEKVREEMEMNLPEEQEIEDIEEIPDHIQLTNKILSCSNQFFTSKDQSEVILVHEIFMNGLQILRNYENILLPAVHQFWYPFIKQIQGKNFIIQQRSFELLIVTATVAKDFIYRKALE
jgi:hypothetical protein